MINTNNRSHSRRAFRFDPLCSDKEQKELVIPIVVYPTIFFFNKNSGTWCW